MKWHNTDGLRKHAKAQRDETQKSGRTRKNVVLPCPHQMITDERKCVACEETIPEAALKPTAPSEKGTREQQ
jgi:hypothetical protein